MCWAKLKAFFAKTGKANERVPQEGPLAGVMPGVDVAAWTLASPIAYLMDGDDVVVLKRARDFYLLNEEDRAKVAAAASTAVTGALDAALAEGGEHAVLELAAAEIDGVYKGAVRLYDKKVRGEVASPYLKAAVKPFFDWLHDHGLLAIHCSNCAFETMDAVFNEFVDYFAGAGVKYICNQHRALQMMQDNGLPPEMYDEERVKYLDKAFYFSRRLQNDCAQRCESFVCIDADGDAKTYAPAMENKGKPGCVVVERSGALRQFERFPMKVHYPEPESVEAADETGDARA